MDTSFLPPDVIDDLQRHARRYAAVERVMDRHQWYFAEKVNSLWTSLPDGVKAEVRMEGFYVECSYWINKAAGYAIVGSSGETLRKWCETAAPFAGLPGLEAIKERLRFDHFKVALYLSNKGKVPVPSYALAFAIEHDYTADELRRHFDPPQPPDDYARATGHLEWMETFDWNGHKAQALPHVRALQELLG